jgi:hypothetical protein
MFFRVLAYVLLPAMVYGQDPEPVDPPAPEAPSITLPDELTVKAGRIIKITAETNGKRVRWIAVGMPREDMDLYPIDDEARSVLFCCPVPGTVTLMAYTALGDQPSDVAICTITIEAQEPRPPPEPGPGPKPPDPKPTPIPTAGNRVLIVYETELAEMVKLPPARAAIITSTVLRAYLTAHQVEGRFLDPDTEFTTEPQVWRDAMKLPRDSVPWIYVSNGKTGYSGPLPENVSDTLAILKKYFGD